MYCIKCGKEVKEGASFCPHCGTTLQAASKVQGKKSWVLPVAAGTVILLIAVIVGSIFLYRGTEAETVDGVDDIVAAGGTDSTDGASDNAGQTADENWRDMEPLYTAVDVPAIDIHAVNYTAGTKVPGITWDSTLFYWLEDVDQTSTEDGYLAKCHITKMLLRSAESGRLVQYEIYRDPATDEIYKIVSIEQGTEEMHLVDYYYQDGMPNFTFSRSDSVYTPTYATPAKVGERYYFNGDVMARWRMIREPNVIGEYVLAPTGASYSQADYYAESAELQAIYDNTELRELNAARNTFDAVTAAGNGIGMVEGRVTDTAGNPVAGVTVDILRAEDGALLYRSVTDEDGSFSIFVYLEDVECSIVIRGDETYDSNSIHGVMLARSNGGSSYGNLLMHRLDGDEYPVHINVYSAADVRTGEDGSLVRDLLSGAEVSLRAGAGARTGEVLQTLEAGADGQIDTTLPAGTYTAQIEVEGYATAYVTVEVAERETTAEGYVLPAPDAGQTGIVLTWEGDADLDLTLFTPYQSTDGDMAHIGGRIADDGHGNRLVADNTSGCELMYVSTGEFGSYKLYVNNYTESEAGNYSSVQFSTLNIHIYIYDSTGLIAEYSFPAGQIGVVWEVADLSGSQVAPSQRVYSSLEGKRWWIESKSKTVLVKIIRYDGQGNINGWEEYTYDEKGNQVRATHYGGDGNINGWGESVYDEKGNQVKIVSYSGDGSIEFEDQYTYDERGHVVKFIGYNESRELSAWEEFVYDGIGNLVKDIEYYSGGIVGSWTEYVYDEKGNQVGAINYNGDGSVNLQDEFVYDGMGNMVKRAVYYSDGSIFWEDEYAYDERGNLVKQVRYNDDGSITSIEEYAYDEMGNQVKYIVYNSGGDISWGNEQVYDQKGNLVKTITYSSGGRISGWQENIYDEAKNLVKSTTHSDDGSISSWTEYIYLPFSN